MSNTRHARILGTACATLVVLVACVPEQGPSPVPNVEVVDEPVDRRDDFLSPDELKYCFRRVPPPRC